MANQITVNGKTFNIPPGRTTSIINGQIIVDGVPVEGSRPSSRSVITGHIESNNSLRSIFSDPDFNAKVKRNLDAMGEALSDSDASA